MLITAGAVLAASDLLFRRKTTEEALLDEWNSPEDDEAYRDL